MLRLSILLPVFFAALLTTAQAQAQKRKQKQDTLQAYRELARVNQWYEQMPVQWRMKFTQEILPAGAGPTAAEADVLVYYGSNNFYMEAEGLEQIVNDSLALQVNSETRMIRLQAADSALRTQMSQAASVYRAGAAVSLLPDRYTAQITESGKGIRQITLQAREQIYGTSLPRESICISYRPDSFQPVTIEQYKRSLVLIDAVTYTRLLTDESYAGRVVKATGNEGDLFFLVKEVHATCSFTGITKQVAGPPVQISDRVVKNTEGVYEPARGYEGYVISSEL
jgi:hypothetical protein